MRRFVSKLAYKLNDFIAYKNALGIKYDTSRVYLLELDQYNLEHGNYALLTKELAEEMCIRDSCITVSKSICQIPAKDLPNQFCYNQ